MVCILQHDVILADAASAAEAQQGGVGDKNNVVVAALVLGGGLGAAFQHAHDAKLVCTHLEGAAEAVAAEDLAVHIVADDADVLVVHQVGVLDAPALGHLIVVDGQIILIDAADVGAAVLLPCHPQRIRPGAGDGRKAPVILRLLVDDVIHIADLHRAGAGGHDVDRQNIAAHVGVEVLHHVGHAVAEADDDDDGHNADDDAQHGEEGADFIAPHVLDGLLEGLLYHACAPSSPAFGADIMRFGCTTASGAWASPS